MTHATTWMNLKNIMLNEISQSEKDKHCMTPLNEVLRAIKFRETQKHEY